MLLIAVIYFCTPVFTQTYHNLSGGNFSQNWTNTGLITLNDDWSGVPSIVGFLGDYTTSSPTAVDPQTVLVDNTTIDVIANQTAPNTLSNGGVSEFHITNPTIALNGSGTADAPFIVIYLNTTGTSNINVQYKLRDLDGSIDNAIQPVALQYRIGSTGNFINIPAGYVSDATTGPSLATLETNMNVTLPAACENQPGVQIRIITTNAVGNDEWVGIDDILITGSSELSLSINDVSLSEGNAGTTNFVFTVSLTGLAGPGGVSFDIATQDNTAISPGDYTTNALTGQTIPEGSSTYLFTVTVNGDLPTEPDETFFVNITNLTGAILSDGQGLGTILNDDFCNPPSHSIHSIQGNGINSPIAGATVSTTGIVTGLLGNGFFIQNASIEYDADPNTSEGIFVFTSSLPPPTAVIGNKVCVSGTVTEFIPSADPSSPPKTEITGPVITILSSGNPLPAPVILTSSDTDPAGGIYQLEKYEGMRVQVNSLTVVAPTQGNVFESSATANTTGYFYGVITGVSRPFREPGIRVPDALPPGAPATVTRWDANPELIGVASLVQPGSTAINVGTGALITNITGPLDFIRRYYTIDVDAESPHVITNNSLTFTPVPQQTNDELTVASFNMQRFFDIINDPGGDVALTATAYNNRLNKVSLAIRTVLRYPDIIGAIEVEKLSVLQDIANKVNLDAVAAGQPNPNYQAYLSEGNDPSGIDVGFLVKSPRITVNSVIQYGKTTTYIDPNNGLPDLLNDRPPLVLNAGFNKPGCTTPYPVTVIVNHLRSLGGIDDPVDGNRVRTKRRAQAEFLANLIQGFQASDPSMRVISVGDYNAFQFNDGFVDVIGTIKGVPTPPAEIVLASSDLVNPDLIDLVDLYTINERYSYVFMGSAQVLDHILINQNLSGNVNRFHIARLDADFPEIVRNDATRPERISDHDVPVAYFLFNDTESPLAVCKNTTVTLVNGTASITAADIDGGSTDNCGIQTLSVSKSVFNCADIGSNTVVLTVTDASGNSSTCNAVVTVAGEMPSCSVTSVPENNIYTGGIPTNIYLGYGPQSVTLDLTPAGGSSFTYSWSGDGVLSCTDCQDPVFTPTSRGVYQFTATLTNNYGCSSTCSITICVLDIRVPGTNGNKVYICHTPSGGPGNGITLAINVNSVADHIPGHPLDKLGKCGEDPCDDNSVKVNYTRSTPEQSLTATVLPNPSSNEFTIKVTDTGNKPVSWVLMDITGKMLSRKMDVKPGSVIKLGNELKSGVYFIEINLGKERKVFKLVKINN